MSRQNSKFWHRMHHENHGQPRYCQSFVQVLPWGSPPQGGQEEGHDGGQDSDAKHEQLTAQTQAPRMRDLETIDAELQLAVAFRCAARERGGPLPSKPWRTRC